MATGKHKRSEVHSGTPLVSTEQISFTVTPEAYAWLKSRPGSISSTIKEILERKYGVFEVENLTPSAAAEAGIKCLECDYFGMEYEDGSCESRCYYSSNGGKVVSVCSDGNGTSGIDIAKRNMKIKGAPSWCPRMDVVEDGKD